MRNKVSVGEYLAFLSLKYEVDPDRFFYALNSALEKQRATCGELLIQRRSETPDEAVFLMTKNTKVVSQFPIPRRFLLEQDNPIKTHRTNGLLSRRTIRKPETPRSTHIRDLKTGMKKINLTAKVMVMPKPTLVFTRFGNYASVTNASLTDETGTIKLCLWNEQISTVSAGDVINIENARMSMFRGEPQLKIGRNGKLNIIAKMEPPKLENHAT